MHGSGTLQWLGALGDPTAPWFLAHFAVVAVSRGTLPHQSAFQFSPPNTAGV